VFVLIGLDSNLASVPDYIDEEYDNIVFARVDFDGLVKGTPVEKLWNTGTLTMRGHYLNNMSNALRIVICKICVLIW
jgi:hypothetical protein